MQAKLTVKSFRTSDGGELPGGTSNDVTVSMLARGPNISIKPNAEGWAHEKALAQAVVEAVERGIPPEYTAQLDE